MDKFDSKLSCFVVKSFFLKKFVAKNREESIFTLFRVKQG